MEIPAAQVDPMIASIVAGLIISNFGLLLGAYVSIRVKIARLEVLADLSMRDINGIGAALRNLKKGTD